MPLTAYLQGRGTLDTTLAGLGCDVPWESVYRTQPRSPLSCTQCSRPMHAKRSGRGGLFFAHDRRSESCPAIGEIEAHRSLKRALAQAAREAGRTSELEVAAANGSWRADVLATAEGRRPVALEAQLSSASREDILARTRRYEHDGIDVVWFTHRATQWLNYVPSARLYHPRTPGKRWARTHPFVHRRFSVEPWEFCDSPISGDDPYYASWARVEEVSLTEFVGGVLFGHLIPLTTGTGQDARHVGWAAPAGVKAARDSEAARTR